MNSCISDGLLAEIPGGSLYVFFLFFFHEECFVMSLNFKERKIISRQTWLGKSAAQDMHRCNGTFLFPFLFYCIHSCISSCGERVGRKGSLHVLVFFSPFSIAITSLGEE